MTMTMPDDESRRHVAAANATVNFLLGGRSKSWMKTTPDTFAPTSSTRQRATTRLGHTTTEPVDSPRNPSESACVNVAPLSEASHSGRIQDGIRDAEPATIAPTRPVDRPATQSLEGAPTAPTSGTRLPRNDTGGSWTGDRVGLSDTPTAATGPATPLSASVGLRTLGTEGTNVLGRPQAHALLGEGTQGVPEVDKSPTIPATEAQVQEKDPQQARVDQRSGTRHINATPVGSALSSTLDVNTQTDPTRAQHPTSTAQAPTAAPSSVSPALLGGASESARTSVSATTSASETALRMRGQQASSLASAETLPRPVNKQRRLDLNVPQYIQSLSCRECRDNDGPCDRQALCLRCNILGLRCSYEPEGPEPARDSAPVSPVRDTPSTSRLPAAESGRPGRNGTDSPRSGTQQQPSPRGLVAASRTTSQHSVPAASTVVPSSTPAPVPRPTPTSEPHAPHTSLLPHVQPTMNSLSSPGPGAERAHLKMLYEPQRCLELINILYSPAGPSGPRRSFKPADQGRLLILRDAVVNGDICFLILHQIWCMTMFDPQRLPDDIKARAGLVAAFSLLHLLFRPNNEPDPSVLGFCVTFPAPLSVITAGAPVECRRLLDYLDDSLQRCDFNWPAFSNDIIGRGIPPMAQEVSQMMNGGTSVLLRLIFLHFARQIFPVPTPQWLRLADTLFLRNLDDWDRYQRTKPQVPPDPSTLRAYNEWFHVRYAAMRQVQVQHPHADPTTLRFSEYSPLCDLKNSPVHLLLAPPGQRTQPNVTPLPSSVSSAPADILTVQHAAPLQQQNLATVHVAPPSTLAPAPTIRAPQPSTLCSPTQTKQFPAKRLLPSPRFLAPQQIAPNADLVALHQAHLRGLLLNLTDNSSGEASNRGFQHVDNMPLGPFSFQAGKVFDVQMDFVVTVDTFRRVAKEQYNEELGRTVRTLYPDSIQYRVRSCLKKAVGYPKATEQRWAVTETSWHPNTYLRFNGQHLELQRKLQHGKDLPVDITRLVQSGVNNLEVFANVENSDASPCEYVFAVETVAVSTTASIRRQCDGAALLPADQCLDEIKKQLSGDPHDSARAPDAADDIIMVSGNLTIPLFEPFSNAKIFDTPVRGKLCPHRECFDLDTFLNTRPVYFKPRKPIGASKLPDDLHKMLCGPPGVPGLNPARDALHKLPSLGDSGPTAVDCWMCPICRGDARPQNLVVDGFLAEVRSELAARGLLDTRAIVVEADGTWSPKVERRESRPGQTGAAQTTSRSGADSPMEGVEQQRPAPVVVDLE